MEQRFEITYAGDIPLVVSPEMIKEIVLYAYCSKHNKIYEKVNGECPFCKQILFTVGKSLPSVPCVEIMDEAEELAHNYRMKFPEWWKFDEIRIEDIFKAGFRANPATFTLAQMEKAFIAGLKFIAVDPSKYEQDAKEYIQSLTPCLKAVHVDMNKFVDLKQTISKTKCEYL